MTGQPIQVELYYQAHVVLDGSWQLRRVGDGRGEAGGFTTEDEAREWCAEMGYEVAG